jgi:hypothetical protein
MPATIQGLDMLIRSTLRACRQLGGFALGSALLLTACDPLLQADDPDIILPIEATNASGALGLKNGIVDRFNAFTAGTQGADAVFMYGGLLADEWRSGDTFEQRNTADARTVVVSNSFLATPFRTMQRVRVEGQRAIAALRAYAPNPASNIALLFNLRAFAENQMGETYCNGIPFSDPVEGGDIIFGDPVPVDSAFKRAIADADSAVANNGGTDATRMTAFAAVIKGRALLNRGLFAAAATAVAAVPTSFVFSATYSLNSRDNQNWALNISSKRYILPDAEGGNGMNWRTANDPRVPTDPQQRTAFDGSSAHFQQLIWPLRTDPVTVASGIEARLIEAEAAIASGGAGVAVYLQKLNEARATKLNPTTGARLLPDLTDPGTPDARVNLLFRERAFWMFGTGHRLGDLRRLIRQYGRGSETVFPTGAWFKGGPYGTDVNYPISIDELNNQNIPQNATTTSQSTCIDRNA